MKVKCLACALVAGMAFGAVAMADPGAKQASGGAIIQSPSVVGEVLPLPKGLVVGHAVYHYATGTWEILRRSSIGGEQPANTTVRGPGPNLIWSAIDPSGFYWNHRGSGLAANEVRDGGVLCGDPLSVVHTINQISFGYQTQTIDNGTLGVSLNVYGNFPGTCAVGPNGGVADFVGAAGCVTANGAIYNITGMPGSVAGEAVAYLVDIDLTGVEVVLPAGPFGWSFHDWVGFASPTGPLLAAQNLISGPGMENGFDVFTASPQVTPLLGNYWFGGSPFAQFWFEVYTANTTCAPSTSGACCVGLTCSVAADASACAGLGGVFTLATPCSTFFCYPAPANDDCLNAQVITGFGTFGYDNRGATTGGEANPACGPLGEDVWFRWNAPCTGSVTLSTCLLNTTDDLFAVYQGSNCGDLNTVVGCDDDGCGVVGGQSILMFNVTQGQNYLFRIGTWNSSAGGNNFFDLSNTSCTGGPQFCDADWCHDGSVGVPDIFCFLSDWFAFVPAARNYGGSPGVPAIFAFLSIWFATGQGPCTP